MTAIEITAEPVGVAYTQLIDAARAHCQTFSLVWREDSDGHADLDTALLVHLVREQQASAWPGTELLGHTALVRHFSLNDISTALLKDARRLYAWQEPERPEDLAFYDSAGRTWMGSVAHEGFAWFEPGALSEDDASRLMPLIRVNASSTPN